MKKLLIAILVISITTTGLQAQPPGLQQVKEEMYKINKVFDSSRYLGFDVSIRYTSDTVYGNFEYEEMSGQYILNERNVYYKMGNMEYVQNDSFAYSIYHDEQLLMMTRDSVSSKSSLFPIKEFVDSVITWYSSLYTISLSDSDGLNVISFTATDSMAPYKRFAIYYEPARHFPQRIEMYSVDVSEPEQSTGTVDVPTKKWITMEFSNYHNAESLDVFDDANYVFFDRIRRQYGPAEKYRAYKFIASGVSGEQDDETIELYPPPAGNQ